MATSRMTFTKPKLDALKPEDNAYTIVDDRYAARRHGTLSIRVAPSGLRSLRVQYRVKDPVTGKWKQAKHVLGDWTELSREKGLSVDAVRDAASAHVRAAQESGLTPTEAERQAKEMAEEAELETQRLKAETMDIRQLGEMYLEHRDAVKPFRGASTRRSHKMTIDRAAQCWGQTPVTELSPMDGTKLMTFIVQDAIARSASRDRANEGLRRVGGRVVADKPGYHPGHQVASTSKSHIRKIMKFAAAQLGIDVRTDIVDTWTPEANRPKRSAMTAAERNRFFDALTAWEQDQVNRPGPGRVTAPDTADILRLAFLAGGRGGEWKGARWSQIENLDNDPTSPNPPVWRFELGERKQGTEHSQVLHPEAVAILRRIRERRYARGWTPQKEDFVFPHSKAKSPSERHRRTVYDAFRSVIEIGKLNDSKGYGETLSPHRVVRASRITQLLEEDGWSPTEVADHLGMKEETIRKHYHVPHGRLERQQKLLAKTPGL